MITLYNSDCLIKLKELPTNSIDSIVTDPPAGIAFMSKDWDKDKGGRDGWISWMQTVATECLRVLKPGGHALVWALPRTSHWTATAWENAGFEIRDIIHHCFGCLSEDTEILTKKGWERLQINDKFRILDNFKKQEILIYDTKTDSYKWETPKKWQAYQNENSAYRIKSDKTDQIVSKEHRCLIEQNGKLIFKRADTLKRLCYGTPYNCSSDIETSFTENRMRTPQKPQCRRQSNQEFNVIQNECGSQEIRSGKTYKTTLATVTKIKYNGIVFCPTVSTGAFIARRKGKIFITGNSGFPKSLDISKAIDKQKGLEREIIRNIGTKPDIRGNSSNGRGIGSTSSKESQRLDNNITAPASPEAQKYDGFGSAIKPAVEQWILLRKPISEKSIAENVLKHGTGGLNIGGSRIGTDKMVNQKRGESVSYGKTTYDKSRGRYPSNLILDNSKEVEKCFPETCSKWGKSKEGTQEYFIGKNTQHNNAKNKNNFIGDSGNASRYFKKLDRYERIAYYPKASKQDRDEGLQGFEEKKAGAMSGIETRPDRPTNHPMRTNFHPTVKHTELMQYLCRLITPPEGIVLDCFMGSGSTGKAAMLEGFSFIGIEKEKDYFDIAKARIEYAEKFPEQIKKGLKQQETEENQPPLFQDIL